VTESAIESMLSPERVARIDQVLDRRLAGLTVLLEDVYMPQNMGACIRTLEALGVQHVHLVEGTAAFEPHAKITQGCHKWVDIHRHSSAESAVRALRAAGFRVLATALGATRTIDELDFSKPAALCFGNEHAGISSGLAGTADELFQIPMWGFSRSYNLSVALGLCMYEATRARRRAIGRESDLSCDERVRLRTRWLRAALSDADRVLDGLAARAGDGRY